MKKLCLFLILMILFIPSYLFSAEIKRISLQESGEKILINLDKYANFRVYQSDKNEVIITFKDADLNENVVTSGSGGDFISKILYEQFPGKISIITIVTKKNIRSLNNKFDYSSKNLVVQIMPEKIYFSNKSPFYKQKKHLVKPGGKQASSDIVLSSVPKKDPSEKKQPQDEKNQDNKKEDDKNKVLEIIPADKMFSSKGSVDTIIEFIENSSCYNSINIKAAVRLAKEERFEEAVSFTNSELKGRSGSECEDELNVFNLWIKYKFFKSKSDNNNLYLLKKEIEPFLYKYLDSPALAYGYALAGLINKDLKNYPMAKGLFEIAEQKYPEYKGMAEIFFNLGEIYYNENELRISEEYLDKLAKNYPDTKFNEDSKLIYGQILYSRKRYFDTIKTLGPFVNENSRVIYEKPDLLKFVADSYFLTGNNGKARELFSRIFNMFPDLEQKDIILSNIGETFENQGDKKKAEKIYNLVTKRYPGTEGFVKSSLKLADNMDDINERELVYKMIVTDFPDSVEGRISLLRLAAIYNEQKRFAESIDTIKILFMENPRALRKDALYIMSEAVTGYLEKDLKDNNYGSALRMAEQNRFYIADMKNYKAHFAAGKVYYETHMYEDSKERLDMAYKLFPDKKNISYELLKYMVLADTKLENYDEALKICDEILSKFKDGDKKGFASEKKGDIFRSKNDFNKSAGFYKNSISEYKSRFLTGEVYLKLGELYKSENKISEASDYFDKAVSTFINIDREKYKNQIAYAAKNSGEINLKLENFEKAVSYFKTVLDFNVGKENFYEAVFNLGESYRGLKRTEDALNEYKKVFSSEQADELFKKLAEQRIREIELENQLDKS